MIFRTIVACLGISQLVCWGVSYNMIGVFSGSIAAELHWSLPLVYGGLTVALLIMGLASPLVGQIIDRYGGRYVMVAGSVLSAAGCVGIAVAHGVAVYYAAWVCLGLAMRLTLYAAAFATLARIDGPEARRPMSQITLLGGISATIFWPLGELLIRQFGWRGALLAYAAFALATVPLHLVIPTVRYGEAATGPAEPEHAPLARNPRERLVAGSLYALVTTLAGILNAGISPNIIVMLGGFGLPAAAAVSVSALRGIGQSSARLCDILFGKRLHPLMLNVLGTLVLPLCFAAGLLSGRFIVAAIVFSFFSGAGNGIAAITRGTLPLVLFDHRTYGAITGRLLVPSLVLSALAPVAYAFVIEAFGGAGALILSIVLASVMLMAAVALRMMFAPDGEGRLSAQERATPARTFRA